MPQILEYKWSQKVAAICFISAIVVGLAAHDTSACPSTSMPGEPYAEVVTELKKKAQASDRVVRVIVEVQCDGMGSAAATGDLVTDQARVARAVEKLSRVMRSAGTTARRMRKTAPE